MRNNDDNPNPLAVGDDDKCQCGDCQHKCTGAKLRRIQDIEERINPGDVVPAGECPKCGSLSYVLPVSLPAYLLPREHANELRQALETLLAEWEGDPGAPRSFKRNRGVIDARKILAKTARAD